MSHVSTLDIEINDLDALDKACKELGLELVRGQKTYKWYGRWMNDYDAQDAAYKAGIDVKDYGKCEHAVRIPGNKDAYEVGVVRNKAGKLKLVYDFWSGGRGLEAKIGAKAGLLRREYNMEVMKKDALKKGFRVHRTTNPATGKPRMVARRVV